MSRWITLLGFATASITVLTLVHYYLWRRLVHDTRIPHPWRRLLTRALIALAVSIPVAMWSSRLIDVRIGYTIGWPAFVWMGVSILLFIGLVLTDWVRLLRWGARRGLVMSRGLEDSAPDPNRRQFMARTVGGAVVTAAAGTAAWGVREAIVDIEVNEVPVALPKLPRELDGFVIAQLSDVHVGYTISRSFIEDLVARTNRIEPDLIAITGDLVDGDVPALADAVAPLAELRARHGVYFVTGNHEYYSGADAWIDKLRSMGIQVLRNEHVRIDDGAHGFDLAGIDDYGAARYGGDHGPDIERAVAGRDASRALVLLAHQPRQVYQVADHGVDLVLSGHTHGGQIWPWHYLVKAQQGFLQGLERYRDTQIFINRGAGYWGPPVRVAAAPEIAKVVLRSELA